MTDSFAIFWTNISILKNKLAYKYSIKHIFLIKGEAGFYNEDSV